MKVYQFLYKLSNWEGDRSGIRYQEALEFEVNYSSTAYCSSNSSFVEVDRMIVT